MVPSEAAADNRGTKRWSGRASHWSLLKSKLASHVATGGRREEGARLLVPINDSDPGRRSLMDRATSLCEFSRPCPPDTKSHPHRPEATEERLF